MKNLWWTVLALALAGCAPEADDGPSELDLHSARITQLEQRLAGLDIKIDHQTARTEEALQQKAKEHADAVADLKNRMTAVEERETSLETSLRNVRTDLAELKESRVQPAVAGSAPPAPTDDFITSPGDDLFPLRVLDVAGRQVVTGTHRTTQEVETDRAYRDPFGDKIPVMETKEVEVNEYGYRVAFSAENLTRTAKELSASAGAATTTRTLGPGETLTNITVESAVGADLAVTAGGQTRRFPVQYGPAAPPPEPGLPE